MLTLFTLFGYFLVIPYKRGGLWSILKIPAVFVALLDVIANYTEWAWVFGWPPKGCYTISQRLDWMEKNETRYYRKDFARICNTFLNAAEEDDVH